LRVIDVSDVSNLYEAGYYDTPGHAYSTYAVGPYAYVADANRGLQIYRNLLIGVNENVQPVNIPEFKVMYTSYGSVELKYVLPNKREVSIKLYNIAGRLVRVLDFGLKNKGEHRQIVNARKFPAGVYFVEFRAGDYKKTMSIVLVR